MNCTLCKKYGKKKDFLDKWGKLRKRCLDCRIKKSIYGKTYNHRVGKSITYADEPRVDLTGKVFGLLTVVKTVGTINQQRCWVCECECGEIVNKTTSDLNTARIKSCGCLNRRKGSDNPCWRGCGEISGDIWWNIRKKQTRKNKKIPFKITIKYAWELFLLQDRKCALTGLELTFGIMAKGTGRTASLDRIDSSKGYTEDNVQWIHKDINWMKNEFDQQYFVEMCKRVAQNC